VTDLQKQLLPVVQNLDTVEGGLRFARATIDRDASQYPEDVRKTVLAASDEITNILKRVFKVQDAVKEAALKK
jgi:hypothetical protein